MKSSLNVTQSGAQQIQAVLRADGVLRTSPTLTSGLTEERPYCSTREQFVPEGNQLPIDHGPYSVHEGVLPVSKPRRLVIHRTGQLAHLVINKYVFLYI